LKPAALIPLQNGRKDIFNQPNLASINFKLDKRSLC
jgi:hypothetical protein